MYARSRSIAAPSTGGGSSRARSAQAVAASFSPSGTNAAGASVAREIRDVPRAWPRARGRCADECFAALAHELHVVAPQGADHRPEERAPLRERFHERDVEVGAEEREREAGRSRSGADVDDTGALGREPSDHGSVGDHQIDELILRLRGREIDARIPLLKEREPARDGRDGALVPGTLDPAGPGRASRPDLLEHPRASLPDLLEHPRAHRPGALRQAGPIACHVLKCGVVHAKRIMTNSAVSFVSPSSQNMGASLDMTKLEALVRRTWDADLQFTAMRGGASTRRYFRLTLPGERTAVAMFVPEGGRPEEVQKAHHGTRWPFLEVQELLSEHGIDVPDVLAEDTTHGWLVIEDLGDDTLANWLVKNPADKTALYQKAVTDLARAQNELAELPSGCVVATRTFDFELLRWEIDHFREWGLDARDKPLRGGDVDRFAAIADGLARRIAELPSGFVHRDYQSRNLMILPSEGPASRFRLVWIDFQDALLGPRVYDLVALLNDSYQEFDRAFVEARLDDYARAAALDEESRARLAGEFDLVTVQRKLKDAGRFVFIDRKKGNPSFLRFVTPTIKKVHGALDRLAPHDDEMAELREILRRAIRDDEQQLG